MTAKNLLSKVFCAKTAKSALPFMLMAISGLSYGQASLSVRVASGDDDAEEKLATLPFSGAYEGEMDLGSSDLELAQEGTDNNAQLVGMRFQKLNLPKGALITKAYIQFTTDNTSKHTDPSSVVIFGEASDDVASFGSDDFHLTNRAVNRTVAEVSFGFDESSFANAGDATELERTADISAIVQEIIDRDGWDLGNSMAIYLKGSGLREAESYDGSPADAPMLVVEYFVPLTFSKKVSTSSDDAEEMLATATIEAGDSEGAVSLTSSDLELGYEQQEATNAQMVGIRYNGVTVPQGAQITNAYIQFTVDATDKNLDPSNIEVWGEASDNATGFAGTDFELTQRAKTTASSQSSFANGTWTSAGESDEDQRTGDLTAIVQEIVDRGGWNAGNSMAFYITGEGLREAESYDGSPSDAPMLVIEYLGTPGNFTSEFPVSKAGSWAFAEGNADADWNQPSFEDDGNWSFGNGPLGFGGGEGTTVENNTATYFSKRFTVADLSALKSNLELNLRVDGGAVVYLNGQEIVRYNMPLGAIDENTKATQMVDEALKSAYLLFDLDKTQLVEGENLLAVEVHLADGQSEMNFDLSLVEGTVSAHMGNLGCTEGDDHISCFTSLVPSDQQETMMIPESHQFQVMAVQGDAYTVGSGNVPGGHDFTGFVPDNGSSTKGVLGINHENNPGGVSMLDVEFNPNTGYWEVMASEAVDFSGLVKTERNCSGGVTPWGTYVTAEETLANGDANSDGYEDVGWLVEIDPKTKKVMEYGTGSPQKAWAMGRISHENAVFADDSLTSYYGEDKGDGNVFKFVADNKGDLSSGKLYVLKLDSGLDNHEPTASVGEWVEVPNTTQSDRNNTKSLAKALGGTEFNGVEDVEISPVDGMIYFTAKGNSRTYRFADNGSTVSDFETFVGGRSYKINFEDGIVAEPWGGGNDNLTFDDHGNLWVLQDGGKNFIWLVRPDHTQDDPKVEIFMRTPSGSEPTGMTFSPDYKFMFLSIQGPSGGNTEAVETVDGDQHIFNKATAVVISRTENFAKITATEEAELANQVTVFPNPSAGQVNLNLDPALGNTNVEIYHMNGTRIMQAQVNASGELNLPVQLKSGMYVVKVTAGEEVFTEKLIVR